MNLYLDCKCNVNELRINYLVFERYGIRYEVDRGYSGWEYDYDSNRMSIEFGDVYVWDNYESTESYINDQAFFDDAILVLVSIEDEAPESYKLEVIECSDDYHDRISIDRRFVI